MNKIALSILALALSTNSFAQKVGNTTKSLVKAEQEFSSSVAKQGANKAFTAYATDDALVFRPNAVNAKTYYATATDMKGLSWSPNFARVSKSGDWGFTAGNYTLSEDKKSYGHYLTVWKFVDGKWKYALDLGVDAAKPLADKTTDFAESKGEYKPRLRVDPKEIAARKEVIMSNEKMLNTLFKTLGVNAFSGFLSENSRLMFPGTETIVGKADIQAFNNRMIDKINLKTTSADRALGEDFAYTYGLATIDYKGMELRESFNYIYIWERNTKGEWNIITQIYNEAVR
jgi:ketosteroid isomerase-like protein